MVTLLLFGLLIGSFTIYRPQLKIAAALDMIIVSLLFAFRVLPGTACFLDWVLILLFLLDSVTFFLAGREVLT